MVRESIHLFLEEPPPPPAGAPEANQICTGKRFLGALGPTFKLIRSRPHHMSGSDYSCQEFACFIGGKDESSQAREREGRFISKPSSLEMSSVGEVASYRGTSCSICSPIQCHQPLKMQKLSEIRVSEGLMIRFPSFDQWRSYGDAGGAAALGGKL